MALTYSKIQSHATCSGTDSIMNLHIALFRSRIEYPLASDLKWIVYGNQRNALSAWITKNKERKSFAVSLALIWTNGKHPSEQQTGSPIAASPVLFPQPPLSPHTFLSSLLPEVPFCHEGLSSRPGTGAPLHLLAAEQWSCPSPCPGLDGDLSGHVQGSLAVIPQDYRQVSDVKLSHC